MPKVSASAKDAIKLGFGIQEGYIEVVGAITKVHQYPPNKSTGVQSDPFPCVQLSVYKTDKSYNRLPDEDAVNIELGLGSLEHFHPGKATGPDDDDPEDLGDELDVEGNTIVSPSGSKLATSSQWIKMAESMERCGFKPEVLGNCWMPDLIGLKGHLKTETEERWAGYKKDKDPTKLVFDKIDVFPYENKGKKAAVTTGKAATGAGKTAAAPPAKATGKSPVSASASSSDDIDTIATDMLKLVMVDMAGESLDAKAIKSKVTAKLMRNKIPVPQHKLVLAKLGDADWMTGTAESLEFAYDSDEQTVQFPEA